MWFGSFVLGLLHSAYTSQRSAASGHDSFLRFVYICAL